MTAPGASQSALLFLRNLLTQWGLEELNAPMEEMLHAGDDAEVIPLKLRETEPYKKRFAGNLERIKAGLPALSEAEYLTTETALKGVVRRYLGAGQYDTKEHLDRWMAADRSPQELNDLLGRHRDKVAERAQARIEVSPGQFMTVGEAWTQAGFTPQQALLAALDPKMDESTLRRQQDVYGMGAEAFKAYKDPAALNRTRLADLVQRGVDTDDAGRAFQDVAGREQNEGFLARLAGEDLSRTEQEDAALGDAQAERKRLKVLDTEQARFNENYLGGGSTLAAGRRPY